MKEQRKAKREEKRRLGRGDERASEPSASP